MQYTIDFTHKILWQKDDTENMVCRTDIRKEELIEAAERLKRSDIIQLIRSHQIITFDFEAESVSGNHDIIFCENIPYPTNRIFSVVTLHVDGLGKKKYHLRDFFEERT